MPGKGLVRCVASWILILYGMFDFVPAILTQNNHMENCFLCFSHLSYIQRCLIVPRTGGRSSTSPSDHPRRPQVRLSLAEHQVLWLRKVHQMCNHSSEHKTLRIILDFYISMCQTSKGAEIEQTLFG